MIKNKNLLLFILSFILLIYGLSLAYIQYSFTKFTTLLVLLGTLLMLISIVGLFKEQKKAFSISVMKKITLFTFIVLCLILFWAEINYLGFVHNKKFDLTKEKKHTLAKETIDFIKDSNKEVKMTALYVGYPPKYLEDMFKEYEVVSKGKIKTEIIDPIEQIGYAAKFGNIIKGKEKKVVVQSGNERRDLDFEKDIITEEQLTNAIVRVTREKRKIYFVTGHGEYKLDESGDTGLSTFKELLEVNNIESHELVIGFTGGIPKDCDVLVIAGPKNNFEKEEEEIVKDYLEKGGDALFLIEHIVITTPDKPLTEEEFDKNPSLNSILKDWGVKVNNDIAVDLYSHAGQDVGCPATRNYMPHKGIINDLDYTFYIRPRTISLLKDRRKSIKLAPIVLTESEQNSWGETNRTLEIKFEKMLDRPGPVPISYVIWEPKLGEKISDTRIIVFTDADFLTNAYIGHYSNSQMGLNIINWLSDLDYKTFQKKKEIEVKRLDLTSKQKRIVIVILFLMPIIIMISGLINFLIKKK